MMSAAAIYDDIYARLLGRNLNLIIVYPKCIKIVSGFFTNPEVSRCEIKRSGQLFSCQRYYEFIVDRVIILRLFLLFHNPNDSYCCLLFCV